MSIAGEGYGNLEVLRQTKKGKPTRKGLARPEELMERLKILWEFDLFFREGIASGDSVAKSLHHEARTRVRELCHCLNIGNCTISTPNDFFEFMNTAEEILLRQERTQIDPRHLG